ncbi:16S rRNA (cytidine(1402)-2'-O)-methyltransferase [Helicobacter saguini]|uniref:16S rRNA (Cytidine(1402)-2'-O)-methyltransferase n=1 Tax=Helicobacter saguini TaxID=1548018 RepID=A0A347VRU3_9HELI|nr:16S rRNA (cytidine(1402)-2'-O)-methyltransferase [Helicobacter saguini]MWV62773.1 16S rRNA (cytidine(1402)-2'-O)-methyltransferase [Helicobacter saguini]MWV66557.1 16S rRNA (cytidine(1402)-2'-O)-methyltransferase [Helicobacter saguini]MWV68907.1 16S rRNA (cytidine(1402)-2'-O)-methyltransferase [Helicobacter saguini]MWV71539.1 16S rRNA (cytidine(1402)-2'-O)-methyltransferase [Helicobacter saguini]TLD93636.1 16S rRNA (cytidine(1402)-2'-O)-methyltransferase [Helicobacter saguini]
MVTFLPTPIGNLNDISLRTLSALNTCEIVICEDTRVTSKLLNLLAKMPIITQNYPQIDSKNKRFLSFHSHNQHDFLAKLDKNEFGYDFFDKEIVFCSDAGLPNISDPGAVFLHFLRQKNIKYEILLGGSAFSHAFVCSGLEGSFCFLGFLPHKHHDRIESLRHASKFHADLHIIYYESPHRLRESLSDISSVFLESKIYLYKELTKLYECEYIGTASQILEALPLEILGEYCIIIEKDSKEVSKFITLGVDEIMNLSINVKEKCKLLAKITDKSSSEWYDILGKN